MASFFTLGYEGSAFKAFAGALQANGVTLLADVRAIAFSRKPGFSKADLQQGLQQAGIAYLHLPLLGNPVKLGAAQGEYPESYLQHLQTEAARAALAALRGHIMQQKTCLMCFERDPLQCHRQYLAAALNVQGFEPQHLFVEDSSQARFLF